MTGYDEVAGDRGKHAFLLHLVLTIGSFPKQEAAREISGELSYALRDVVPGHTYRARIRTRVSFSCHERPQWSEWSEWSNDAGRCHSSVSA